jgi:pimeloyl-ACP methyl ester carboxylesterase
MPSATLPDGVRLYYETRGAGEPLLLVMGRASDHHGWGAVPGDFATRWQVIVYDHRGTGQSDKPESPPYTTRGFAQDAVGLLDQLGIERAHVYGISMGGMVAQWLAIEHGTRVGALVLGCTSPGLAHGVRRLARVEADIASGNMLRVLTKFYSPLYMLTHLNELAAMQPAAQPMPAYAEAMHGAASIGHEAWDQLPTITAPTLVIYGGRDEIAPAANAHRLAERIPGAELHIVPRGRHMFYLEFRTEVDRVIGDFLQRHSLRAGGA